MARKNKEKYLQEMEVYKQKKDEEAENLRNEEEEHKKLQKQEAMQLLKKKEKTENIIKVTFNHKHNLSFELIKCVMDANWTNMNRKPKRIARRRRRRRKRRRLLTPTSPRNLHPRTFCSGKAQSQS